VKHAKLLNDSIYKTVDDNLRIKNKGDFMFNFITLEFTLESFCLTITHTKKREQINIICSWDPVIINLKSVVETKVFIN
jgi:hypothetical protein